jgi:GxxExxY protein
VSDYELTERIIGAAIEVHRQMGPGLLESVYESCLAFELTCRNMPFERQKSIPLIYKGTRVGDDLRLDLVVENRVILELKAVKEVLPIHEAQLLTYLKLTGLRIALLFNFNVVLLKDGGIHRFVLD